MKSIELTAEEKEILAQIDFHPESFERHDPDYWRAVGDAALRLMKSLIAREAIPKVRTRYFTDPEFNIGGRSRSRAQVFEKNGTRGEDIFRHSHFLKYLRYFLYGPELPIQAIQAFQEKIAACGPVTSGDILPLGQYAKQLTRENALDPQDAAEEFFKLAIESDLDESDARCIYDRVRKGR